MARQAILASFLVILAASPGCTSLTLRGERVRLTKTPADVEGCRAVGPVKAVPPFMGGNDWKYLLQNQAADLGADVVLHKGAEGTAYDCGGRYAR